jgi:hypothetical protein
VFERSLERIRHRQSSSVSESHNRFTASCWVAKKLATGRNSPAGEKAAVRRKAGNIVISEKWYPQRQSDHAANKQPTRGISSYLSIYGRERENQKASFQARRGTYLCPLEPRGT